MKFSKGFGRRNETDAGLSSVATNSESVDKAAEIEGEITDETLLEAIVGTGSPSCQEVSGMGRSPAGNNSQGRHKHR